MRRRIYMAAVILGITLGFGIPQVFGIDGAGLTTGSKADLNGFINSGANWMTGATFDMAGWVCNQYYPLSTGLSNGAKDADAECLFQPAAILSPYATTTTSTSTTTSVSTTTTTSISTTTSTTTTTTTSTTTSVTTSTTTTTATTTSVTTSTTSAPQIIGGNELSGAIPGVIILLVLLVGGLMTIGVMRKRKEAA